MGGEICQGKRNRQEEKEGQNGLGRCCSKVGATVRLQESASRAGEELDDPGQGQRARRRRPLREVGRVEEREGGEERAAEIEEPCQGEEGERAFAWRCALNRQARHRGASCFTIGRPEESRRGGEELHCQSWQV